MPLAMPLPLPTLPMLVSSTGSVFAESPGSLRFSECKQRGINNDRSIFKFHCDEPNGNEEVLPMAW
eukprot:1949282-Lingulodinium_polyedra.AAC.1